MFLTLQPVFKKFLKLGKRKVEWGRVMTIVNCLFNKDKKFFEKFGRKQKVRPRVSSLSKRQRSFIQWRVWSWLRMNASGRPNTCKSNGSAFRAIGMAASGARVSNTYATCLLPGNSSEKSGLMSHNINDSHELLIKVGNGGKRWACVPLASWWGNGSPRLRWVGVLRGLSPTLVLRHGPDSYGRQQWGILVNGRKPEPAMPRAGWRPYGL